MLINCHAHIHTNVLLCVHSSCLGDDQHRCRSPPPASLLLHLHLQVLLLQEAQGQGWKERRKGGHEGSSNGWKFDERQGLECVTLE